MATLFDSGATAGTPSVPVHRRDGGRAEPLNTAELISIRVRTELLVAMALRRAAGCQHYVCIQPPEHASGPDPTACINAEHTLPWWWCTTHDGQCPECTGE